MLFRSPIFFLSSGFFLVGHSDEKKWWKVALIKRIKTLFTYLLVNLMYFPFVNYFANRQGGGILSALGFVFPRNPACGPMWYVRNLFFLFVLAPFFVSALRVSKKIAWIIVFVCLLAWGFLPLLLRSIGVDELYIVFDQWFSICGLTFFMVGIALRIYGIPHVSRAMSVLALLLGFICSWLIAMSVCCQPWHRILRVVCPIMLVLGCYGLVPSLRWHRILRQNCFAIYAFHMLVIYAMEAALAHIGNEAFTYTFPGAVLFVVVPISFCILFAELLRLKLPLLTKIILGGR